MSTTIDQRVVEMRFDNKQFEANVSTTMSSLDKLKQSLKLTDSAKGFDNINAAAKRVNMSGVTNAVETVGLKFNAMYTIADQALRNITNSAMAAGKRIVNSLTIDPIKTGFSEYETKINAVQTIMSNTASKGTTMSDVTRVLNELNLYADKTIYNFAEMTKNIGTFTAAGVGLEDSAAAIQGIANLAAASGSTSQQAATAMYQLSQALSSGTVKLMDWNSVVNAGMGGEKFQNALKETARIHGVAVDDLIKKHGSFRESLSEGWITADILNETLKKFTVEGAAEYADSLVKSGKYTQEQADALKAEAKNMEDAATKVKTFTQLMDTLKESIQSGWSQTWEILFGDFEEAREFFSEMSEKIGNIVEVFSNSRNDLLQGALGSPWEEFNEKINKAGIETEDFQRVLKETAKESGYAVDDLIKKHGSLAKAISSGDISANIITKTLKKFAKSAKGGAEAASTLEGKLEKFQKIVDDVWRGDYGNGEARIKALTEAGYDFATVQELVNKCVNGHRLTIEDLSEAQLEQLGFTKEQIKEINKLAEEADAAGEPLNELIERMAKPSGRELLIDSIKNIFDSIVGIGKEIGKAWRDIFAPTTSNELYSFVENINKLTERFKEFVKAMSSTDEKAGKIRRTFKGLFALIDIIGTIVGGPLTLALKIIGKLIGATGDDILTLTASIGDAIVGFRDWLDGIFDVTSIFERIAPLLKDAGEAFGAWVEKLKTSENLPRDIVAGLVKGLLAGIKLVVAVVIELGKTILDTIKAVLGIHSPSREFMEIGKNIIDGLVNGLKEGMPKVWQTIKNLGSKAMTTLKNILGKIDFKMVFAGGLSIASVTITKQLLDVVSAFTAPMEGVGEMMEGLGKMFIGLKKMFAGLGSMFKAKAWELRSKAIINLAVAIAILVASIAVLTMLDTGKMWGAVGAIAAISAILVALAFTMSKLGEIQGVGISSLAILGIAVSLLLVAGALKKIAGLSGGDIAKGLFALTVAMAGMAGILLGFEALANPKNEINLAKAGSMLIKMSFALLIMVGVIKIASALDKSDLKDGLAVIIPLMLLFAGIVAVSKFAGEFSRKAGSMLLQISIALLLMVGVVKTAAQLKKSEVYRGLGVISTVMVLFAAIIAASNLAGQHAGKAGLMLLMMSGAILILTGVIALVGLMKVSTIIKGLIVIGLVGVLFAAIIKVSEFAGEHAVKAGIMLTLMAGAILVLSGAMFVMSKIDPARLAISLIAVGLLGQMFSYLIKVSSKAKKCMGTLVTLTVAIGILSLALMGLSFMDQGQLMRATLSLSMIIATFSLLVWASKFAGESSNMKGLVTLLLMVGILSVVVIALSKLDADEALESCAALSILLTSMALAMAALGKSKGSFKSSAGKMLTMLVVIAGLALILAGLAELNIQDAIPKAVALSALLVAMSIASVILSKFGGNAKGIALGGLAMSALLVPMAGLSLILSLLSYLNPQASMRNVVALSALLGVMTAVAVVMSIFGSLAGNIALGGLAMSVLLVPMAGLAIILAMMSGMGIRNAMPNVLALSALLGVMTGVAVVLSVFGALAANIALGGLAMSLLLIPIAGLALILAMMTQMGVKDAIPHAEALSRLLTTLTLVLIPLTLVGTLALPAIMGIGVLTTLIVAVGALLVAIGALVEQFPKIQTFVDTGIPVLEKIGYALGSFFGNIVGGFLGGVAMGAASSLPFLGTTLSTFMTNAAPFFEGAKNIDATAMEGIRSLAQAVLILTGVDILQGLTSWLTGGSSLVDFGMQLALFAPHFRKYCDTVRGIDGEVVQASANAALALAEMASNLPNSGGIISWFTGENSLSAFATELAAFGPKLKEYSDSVRGVDADVVTNSANAALSLSEMASKLPNQGGMVSWFTGENRLSVFAEELAAFGPKLKAYSDSVKGISSDAVTGSANAALTIAEMASKLPNQGGVASWFAGDNKLSTFAEQLIPFGKAMKAYDAEIAGINGDTVVKSANAAKALVEIANNIPNSGGLSQLFGGSKKISSFGEQLRAFGSALKDYYNEIKDITTAKFSQVIKAVRDSADEAVEAAESKYPEFKKAGKHLADGLADGIDANAYKAEAKARAMARAAAKAAEDELDINSPSKVFRKIGTSIPEGFAQGIERIGDVSAASTYMADSALDNVKRSISRISDIVDSDIDSQPTIRPVLDLSDVKSGVGLIGGLFDANPSVGVLSNLGAIGYFMDRNRQNGANDDVVSAIDKLRSSIGKTGDTYHIDGITYDDGSNISEAVKSIVRAARVERRV